MKLEEEYAAGHMGDEAPPMQTAARTNAHAPRDDGTPSAQLEIRTSIDPRGAPVLEVSGEIDLSNVAKLGRAIDAVAAGHPGRLVLDVSSVTFMDSSGIHTLIAATQRIRSVSLRSPSWQVSRLVETMGLAKVLPLER